jgi:hypothetical protein
MKEKQKMKNNNNQNRNQLQQMPESESESSSDESVSDNNNSSLTKEKKKKNNKAIKETICELLPDGNIKVTVKYIREKIVVDGYFRYKKWTQSFKSNRGIGYLFIYFCVFIFTFY